MLFFEIYKKKLKDASDSLIVLGDFPKYIILCSILNGYPIDFYHSKLDFLIT